jgi:hypothetical protein
MSDTSNPIITFVDHIGRTLIGEHIGDVDNGQSFVVKNPAIIHVQPTQQGQLNVQTIPLYFREFVGEKNQKEGTQWKFHYASVVVALDVENDSRLLEQYTRLFTATPSLQPVAGASDAKTVKLFDE